MPHPGVNPWGVSTLTPAGMTPTLGCRGGGVMGVGVGVKPWTPQGWPLEFPKHALASCHAHEYETIAELYQFKAWHRATNLDKKEVNMGIMQVAMNQHGHYASSSVSSPARKACVVQASDGMLLCSLAYCVLDIAFAGTVIESASGWLLTIRLD